MGDGFHGLRGMAWEAEDRRRRRRRGGARGCGGGGGGGGAELTWIASPSGRSSSSASSGRSPALLPGCARCVLGEASCQETGRMLAVLGRRQRLTASTLVTSSRGFGPATTRWPRQRRSDKRNQKPDKNKPERSLPDVDRRCDVHKSNIIVRRSSWLDGVLPVPCFSNAARADLRANLGAAS